VVQASGDVVRLARQWQRQIARRQEVVIRQILAEYARLYRDAKDVLARDDPEAVAAFRASIAKRMAELASDLNDRIVEGVEESARMAMEAEREKLEAAYRAVAKPGAVKKFTIRTPWGDADTRAWEALSAMLDAESPLHRAFVSAVGERAAATLEAILKEAEVGGLNPREAARRIRKEIGATATWALTHARTSMLWAARLAALHTYEANSDVVGGWVWHSARDSRTCAACWMMHGTVHTLNEPLRGHYNCRCAMVPLVKIPDAVMNRQVLGLDIPLPDSGYNAFVRLPIEEQQRILGPATWLAWQQGKIDLRDLVGQYQDKAYGRMYVRRSLSDIIGGDGMRQALRDWRWLQDHPPESITSGELLREYLRRQFGAEAVGPWEKAPPDVARWSAQVLADMMKRWPMVTAENFNVLQWGDEDYFKQYPEAFAYAIKASGVITLNTDYFGDDAALAEMWRAVRSNCQTRWFACAEAPRTYEDAFRKVLEHEFGHLAHGWLIQRIQIDSASVGWAGYDVAREYALVVELARKYDKWLETHEYESSPACTASGTCGNSSPSRFRWPKGLPNWRRCFGNTCGLRVGLTATMGWRRT